MIYNLGTNLELFIKSRYYQQRIASCDQKNKLKDKSGPAVIHCIIIIMI